MLYDASAILSVLSGLALLTLGLVVFTIRPIRAPAAAFGLFAILWGLMLAGTNTTRMLESPNLRFWATFMLVLVIPLYVPLLYFATTYPWATRDVTRHWTWWLVIATPAVILLMLLGAEPRLFIQELGVPGAPPADWWGPLYWPVTFWSGEIAFVVAAGILILKLCSDRRKDQRDQIALAAAALLVYVSYRAAAQLSVLISTEQGSLAFWLRLVSVVGGTIVVAASAIAVGRRREMPWRDLVLASCTVPYLVGLAEILIGSVVDTWIWTTGLWRLALVGIFLFALARHRMFDAALRVRTIAAPLAYVVVLFLVVGVLVSLFGPTFTERPLLGAAAFVGVAGATVPSTRVGSALALRVASHVQDPEYLERRKLEVYRAALQEAHASGGGRIDIDDLFLSDLRRRLGISKDEHRALLMVLKTQARLRKVESESSGVRQRAQELEDHLYGTTHDMKTPLLTLDWLTKDLEAALADATDDPMIRDTIEHMRTTVGGMDRLVQDVLVLARADAAPDAHASTDVRRVVQEVCTVLEAQRKRSAATIDIDVSGTAPMADAALRHVVHNLVSNGLRYGGRGVTVLVRGRPSATGYELTVEDDGPGLGTDDPESLFEAFHRGERSAGTDGTGLGLALVRRILRRHGGDITAESVNPGGARFVAWFPA